MDLSSKKRMAAEILKVGLSRVKLDPKSAEQIEDAITKNAIRGLIKNGVIWAVPEKGVSRGRVKKRGMVRRGRGRGSIEGASGARTTRKSRWVTKVRALRRHLGMLKDRGEITGDVFNRLYLQVKGGQIKSLRYLRETVRQISRR